MAAAATLSSAPSTNSSVTVTRDVGPPEDAELEADADDDAVARPPSLPHAASSSATSNNAPVHPRHVVIGDSMTSGQAMVLPETVNVTPTSSSLSARASSV